MFLLGTMLLLLLLIVMSESRQRKINWYPSFSVHHKIPYGSYIAYTEARKIFGDNFKPVRVSPYLFFNKHPEAKGTYVIYNSHINLGKTALNTLLNWVKDGNNLIMSSENFEQPLLDSLHLKEKFYIEKTLDNRLVFNLVNPVLKSRDSIIFDKKSIGTVLLPKDSLPVSGIKLLGQFMSKGKPKANFIQVSYGQGQILLHTMPYVFTNYFILKNNNIDYYNGVLSYINLKKPVYWDVQVQNGASSKGVFQYIIQNPGFLWAYRLLFIGLLVYIIFEGKRKQRAIPVVVPPKNETLSFTKTIGDMYIENKEHRQIALMHIKHFMDYVRTQLHIDTRATLPELTSKIAQKTKTDKNQVINLFELIEYINNSTKISMQTVMDLNKKINEIKGIK